jgi:hypothetical protein
MTKRFFRRACVLIWLAAVPLVAQQGHPLTGTWAGTWGPDPQQRHHLTFVMTWDGDKVSGTINPGPDAIPIGNINLDLANWIVHIEAETRDASGAPVRIVAEGKLENLGSYHRTISGTWRQGSAKGDFRIVRD